MGRASTAAYDSHLTNFAHGLAPDINKGLADIMAPEVEAPSAGGHYKSYDTDDAFRVYDTRRALGGKGRRIEMDATDPRFDCSPHALEIAIDDFEYEKAGAGNENRLKEAKVKTLISVNALSREKRVFDVYEAGTTAEVGAGDWTDPTVDPIDELDAIIADLAIETGRTPTDLVLGLPALQQARKHPKVMSRFPGIAMLNINAKAIEGLLILPVRVHIGMLSYTSAKPGKKGVAKETIVGSRVYALLNTPSPTEFDPSAAKTFVTRRGSVQGVRLYREEPHADIAELDWSEDIKLTGAMCVKRIDVTTGSISEEGGEG